MHYTQSINQSINWKGDRLAVRTVSPVWVHQVYPGIRQTIIIMNGQKHVAIQLALMYGFLCLRVRTQSFIGHAIFSSCQSWPFAAVCCTICTNLYLFPVAMCT